MTDAEFFALFGLDVPATNERKTELFKELVSLFDSLHDFGTFGSVYDYVTKNKDREEYFTNRRTIFNHLRNGYPGLQASPQISTKNSQLHCFDIGFHLKASLTKAKLEDAFFNYAANNLISAANKSSLEEFKTPAALKEKLHPDAPLVFSVDTQKKLFAIDGLNGWQTYDREKKCDPAGHSDSNKNGILILTELNDSKERIYNANGIKLATVSGTSVELASIKIDLEGSPGDVITMTGSGSSHKNNVSNVNKQLKTIITAGTSMPDNISKKPELTFYTDVDYTAAASAYLWNVRRKLAQKRLGDQLQVLACKNGINYQDIVGNKYKVTNPIFVSIDRMAIAFAIAHGVTCIYSNGSKLQIFKGSKTTMEPIAAGGSKEIEKIKRGGRFIVEWEILTDQLHSSPANIMRLFMYNIGGAAGMVARRNFSESVDKSEIISLDDESPIYKVRSYRTSPDNPQKIIIDNDVENENPLVFIVYGLNKWKIVDGGDQSYTLKKTGINDVVLRLQELHGLMRSEVVMDTMDGGGKNKYFLKTLAQYDLLTLCDEEQTRIWYDEFYTRDDGFTFHSPTFYELNAFFQVLFEENIDYMLIFPFLKNSSDPFSKDVLYAIERILDYMDISVPYDTEVDKVSENVLLDVLKRASEKSKKYGHSISTLKGSKLLDYLFEHNLTPLYFYNVYSEKYPRVKVKEPVTTYNSKMLSRKRRYNTHLPMVGVKAGGKKKYKGSPRRRTLRKTRRHR